MIKRPLWQVFAIVLAAMLTGVLVAEVIASSGQAGQAEPAKQAELACQQARQAELELLAGNVLEGHDVTIIDGHVTIYLDSGEVLASGEFLEGTEMCQIGDR
jgi:hypothetical protein